MDKRIVSVKLRKQTGLLLGIVVTLLLFFSYGKQMLPQGQETSVKSFQVRQHLSSFSSQNLLADSWDDEMEEDLDDDDESHKILPSFSIFCKSEKNKTAHLYNEIFSHCGIPLYILFQQLRAFIA